MKTPARVRTNGFLPLMTLVLTASCWGCGNTAEIEMIHGPIGHPDTDIQVFEVQSSLNADCKRGVTLLAIQDWSDAAQAFQLALAADAGDHRAMFGMGVAHEKEGDPCAALANYKKAVELTDARKQPYIDAVQRTRDKCDP